MTRPPDEAPSSSDPEPRGRYDGGDIADFDAEARLIGTSHRFGRLIAAGQPQPQPGALLGDVIAALIGGATTDPTPTIMRHLKARDGVAEDILAEGRRVLHIGLSAEPEGRTRLTVLDVTRDRQLRASATRRDDMLRLIASAQAAALADGEAAIASFLHRLIQIAECHHGLVLELRADGEGLLSAQPLATRGAWTGAFDGLPPPVLLRALDTLTPIRADDGMETSGLGHTAILPVFDRDRTIGLIALSGRAMPFDDDLMDCLKAAPTTLALLLSLKASRRRSHQTARDLRASRGQVQAIFDTISDGVLMFSASGMIVGINTAAERLFGVRLSDTLGRTITEFLPDDDLAGFADTRREICARRVDGGDFPAEVSVSRIAVEEDPLLIAIVQDISERKRVARVQSELIATVGHDLRTPLTSILGALRLVNGGSLAEDRSRDMLGIAERNGRRLMRLITDLLDLERINAGMIAFAPVPTDLGAVLRQSVDNQRPLTEAKTLNVEWQLPDQPLWTHGDPDRLTQIATNIFANAVHFSPRGGTVTIHADIGETTIRVAFVDQGPGIPADFLPVMFDRFQQVANRVRRVRHADATGSGLGLSIVRALVEMHGGRVGAESSPGSGATVYFELPRETTKFR